MGGVKLVTQLLRRPVRIEVDRLLAWQLYGELDYGRKLLMHRVLEQPPYGFGRANIAALQMLADCSRGQAYRQWIWVYQRVAGRMSGHTWGIWVVLAAGTVVQHLLFGVCEGMVRIGLRARKVGAYRAVGHGRV